MPLFLGNNAQVRVIVDGTSVASGSSDIGFVINASDSILRGLTVTGFGIGVEIPNPTDVGDLIQGDSIERVPRLSGRPVDRPRTVVPQHGRASGQR